MSVDMPLCVSCEHLNRPLGPEGFTCTAYPRGIPVAIIDGEVDHRKPYQGDNGIQYERADDYDGPPIILP